jgi:hypothetical protein
MEFKNNRKLVKSMYLDLINGHSRFSWKYIWKIKVPFKIIFFLCGSFIEKLVILTKDNLARWSWTAVRSVVFVTRIKLLNIYLSQVLQTCSYYLFLSQNLVLWLFSLFFRDIRYFNSLTTEAGQQKVEMLSCYSKKQKQKTRRSKLNKARIGLKK